MALSVCLALFHQFGTISIPSSQMRKLRLRKEMPFHFGAPATSTCAKQDINSCSHSSPHLHPRTGAPTHHCQTHVCALTRDSLYKQARAQEPMCTCGLTCMCVCIYVHPGHALRPHISVRVGKGAQIKRPKSNACRLPASFKCLLRAGVYRTGWGMDRWLQAQRVKMALH